VTTKAKIRKLGKQFIVDYKPEDHYGTPFNVWGNWRTKEAAQKEIDKQGWLLVTRWS
jgi:hypothetical protein